MLLRNKKLKRHLQVGILWFQCFDLLYKTGEVIITTYMCITPFTMVPTLQKTTGIISCLKKKNCETSEFILLMYSISIIKQS